MKVQRKQAISDKLELCDETGKVCETIDFTLDHDRIVRDLSKARIELAAIAAKVKQNSTEDSSAALGQAIEKLFCVIFGEDGAEKIFQHYENRYIDIMTDIMPWLVNDILPRFDALAMQKEQTMRTLHSQINKHRRRHKRRR